LAIALVVFVFIYLFSTYDSPRFISMGMSGTMAIVFFGLYFAIRKFGLPEKYMLPVTGGMALGGWGLVAYLIGVAGEEFVDFGDGIVAGMFVSATAMSSEGGFSMHRASLTAIF
jgi:hypothetical protein